MYRHFHSRLKVWPENCPSLSSRPPEASRVYNVRECPKDFNNTRNGIWRDQFFFGRVTRDGHGIKCGLIPRRFVRRVLRNSPTPFQIRFTIRLGLKRWENSAFEIGQRVSKRFCIVIKKKPERAESNTLLTKYMVHGSGEKIIIIEYNKDMFRDSSTRKWKRYFRY